MAIHELEFTFETAADRSLYGYHYDSASGKYKYTGRTTRYVRAEYPNASVNTRNGKDGICLWLSGEDQATIVNQITNDIIPLSIEIGVISDGTHNPSEVYFGNCAYTEKEYNAIPINTTGIAVINPTLITIEYEKARETVQWFSLPLTVLDEFIANKKGFTFQPGPDIYDKSKYEFTYAQMPRLRITYRYKPSTFNITNNNNTVDIGSTANATVSAKTDEYSHTLSYFIDGETGSYDPAFDYIREGVSTCSIIIPMSWCSMITDKVQATGRAVLQTFDGQFLVGTYTVYFILQIPATVVPDAGSIVYATTGIFTVPASKLPLQLSLNGYSGAYGATITKYSISFEGYVIESTPREAKALVIDALKENAADASTRTATATATVTDSRGRITTISRTLTIYKWELAYFSTLSVQRCDEYGNVAADGRYALIQGTYACYPVNNENTLTSLCSIRIHDQITGTETDAGNLTSGRNKVIGDGQLSPDKQYEIIFTLNDRVTYATYSRIIFTSAFAIHVKAGGTSVAFGQAASVDNTVTVSPSWSLIVGNGIDVGSALASLQDSVSVLDADLINVLLFGNNGSNTNNGVTFTSDGAGNYSVSGTSTATLAIHNFFYDLSSLPSWLKPGKTYTVQYSSTNVNFQVWFYKDGAYYAGKSYKADGQFTVPDDAEGAMVRLSVRNGTAANETVSPRIWTDAPNNVLQTQILALAAQIAALQNN